MESPVQAVDAAFAYIITIAMGLLTLITIVMIYFVIRYRRSANPEPADIRGNVKLELFWMILPTVIALTMFYVGWSSYLKLRGVPAGALEVNVTGVQFAWIFTYPNRKESENMLMAPRGKPVRLNITSEDVIHSLYVPAFRIKMDAVPGMKTYAWFYPDKIGDYTILCAEYCGVSHADMTGILRVVPEEEFAKWLQKK